jgi:alpha-L-fucosidase
MTMNDTWGFKSYDHNWKSTETLLRNLIDIASKGGNYLLNVGPTSEGLIPAASVERLKQVGEWMQTNGEAIYGTTASPFKKLPWGRCTQKPGKLYLHVFDWPKARISSSIAFGNPKPQEVVVEPPKGLFVPGLENTVTKAYLLADENRTPLDVATDTDGVTIKLPPTAPDKIASVVVLEIGGKPDVAPYTVMQAADGSVSLGAEDAVIHGRTARCQSSNGHDNIGYWSDKNDWVSWYVRVKTPGKFNLEIVLSCIPDDAGSKYTVTVADRTLPGTVESTGDWDKFVTSTLGTVTVAESGRYLVTVRPTTMPKKAVMNLQSVTLKPVKP